MIIFVLDNHRWQGEGINPKCSLGTHFWGALNNECTPQCAEQRSPQGTWCCSLLTHGHCWNRPSTNPVQTHLLCCFQHQAKQGTCQELVGMVHSHDTACAALLQRYWSCKDFSPVLGRSKRIYYKATKKTPGLQTCPARNGFLPWINKHVLLTWWR